jgi:transcriptional regulator with XRE-family HTH domain
MPWENTRHLARTLACNGALVRFFRRQRGWTQQQLAVVAGYTERLVRKAETGQRLNADTIEDLAEALSTRSCIVNPEDLITDPRAAVWTYIESFARYERQLVARAQDVLAQNIHIICPGNPNFLPFAGTYDGLDEFDRWPRAFFGMFERTRKKEFLDGQLIVEGKRAAYFSSDSVCLRGGGPEWHNPLVWAMELDRGKIIHVESSFDTQAGMEFVRQYGKPQAPSDAASE